MKILFICGSLDPGKGGLGDYVYQLATELHGRGHQCACIALNDSETNFETVSANDFATIEHAKLFRITKDVDNKTKSRFFNDIINLFDPDVVSFQLVIYAYHPRGWMGVFNKYFAPALTNRPVHLMWQELWIGMLTNSSMLHRIEGIWQKHQVMQMLKIVKPGLHQTSIPFYQKGLKKIGIEASILPMFSNFSLDEDKMFRLRHRIDLDAKYIDNSLVAISFGAIFNEFPFAQWLAEAKAWHEQTGKNIILCSVGRMGGFKKSWDEWEELARPFEYVKLRKLGTFEPAEAQAIFSQADVGVALTSLEGWGKSTSIAAMLENGLPVMGYEFGIAPKSLNFSVEPAEGLIVLKAGLENNWPLTFQRRAAKRKLPLVAEQFVNDLKPLFKQ